MCTRGIPTTCSSRILDGWKPPYDATVVGRLRDAGAVDDRQDEPRRVRDGLEHRELGVRPDPQPVRHVARARRIERRIGRRGRRRVRAAGARLRHRRLDPPAGVALRRRRREADVRARQPLRPRRVRVEPRSDRPVRQHRGRRGARPRGHLRPRPDGLDLDRPGRARRHSSRSTGAWRACASARITDLPDGSEPRRGRASRRRRSRRSRARGAEIVDVERAGARLRPHRLLPDRAGRGVEQPRPLRRRPLRAARRRAPTRTRCTWRRARPASATR